MQELITLWRKYCPDIEEGSFLDKLALDFGMDNDYLNRLIWALVNKKDQFENKPRFGISTIFKYNWTEKNVEIVRGEEKLEISLKQWIDYLRMVDLIFSKMLPLGTVVKLREEKIPENILRMFTSNPAGLCIQILARKVVYEDNTYTDYLGTIWPIGLEPDIVPIPLSNYAITEIIDKGYSNEIEEEYVIAVKKRLLEEKKESHFFYNLKEVISL